MAEVREALCNMHVATIMPRLYTFQLQKTMDFVVFIHDN